MLLEGFRSILWVFTSLALGITDYIYKIIMKFFSLNINQFPFIKSFYIIIISAVGFFMMFRIAAMFVQGIWGENKIDKLDGVVLVQRIVAALVILSFIPFAMPRLNEFATESAKIFPKIVSAEDEMLPSTVIIEAGNAEFIGKISSNDKKVTLETITDKTINVKDRGEFTYFPKTQSIVLVLFLAGICAYTFLNVAIQVIIRMVSLLIKMVLAPYAVSGLVDPDDQGTATWFKLCFSDYLAIFFQMVTMWISLMFATHLPTDWSGFEKGIAFVGAIFAIINAPSGIAQILGADIGAQSAMQSLQSVQMVTGAVGAGFRLAKAGVGAAAGAAMFAGKVGSAAKTGAALGIYAAGRKMGARSLNPMNAAGSGLAGNGDASFGGGMSPAAFGEPPTEKQLTAAQQLGISGAEQMSKGQLSQELERSGMEKSYWHGLNANGETGADSRLGQIGQSSRAGGMATAFASYMYKKSADRIFTNNQQRKQMKHAVSAGARISNARKGVRNLGNVIRNAGRNGGIEHGSE